MCVVTLNTVKLVRCFIEKASSPEIEEYHTRNTGAQMFLWAGGDLGNVFPEHPRGCLKLLLHSRPWCFEILSLYWRKNVRCHNRIGTEICGFGVKKNLSKYSSLIGVVFVNLVTLMPDSVNYAITFTCMKANLQFLLWLYWQCVVILWKQCQDVNCTSNLVWGAGGYNSWAGSTSS